MKIEPETVKGFQDFLPPISIKRRSVKRIIEKYYSLYGFLPVETPFIEFDELMKPDLMPNQEEDEAVSDRFKLKDRAGRNLGLRYEFTFQLARLLKQNPNLKFPFKRYQIGEVFRDEPIGAGRFRQFTQCDADIIGDPTMEADAECLKMVAAILKELSIESDIQINNRKLMNAIIESVEIKDSKSVMRELDKIDKIGEDMLKLNLKKYADTNQIITLFKILEKDLQFFLDNAFDGAKEVKELITKCKSEGVEVQFNPFLIRGLSYYTGNIFEIKGTGKNTIAAGGRYDRSVGKYLGREIPAVGISFGLERVTELAEVKYDGIKLMVISIGQDKAGKELVKTLRKENISTIFSSDKVGKSLEYANSYSIPYVVFLGEDEIKKERFKVRTMTSGVEKDFTKNQLIKFLEEL